MVEDPLQSEVKAASASLVLALAAAENGDWAAAEQSAIDAQQRLEIILRELQMKLAQPPSVAEQLDDSDMHPAGQHAKRELTDRQATPGTGMLPDRTEGKDVDPAPDRKAR